MDKRIKRALISVSDKQGIIDLAHKLHDHGIELLSTGGSAKILREAGIAVTELSDYTGFPEMLDGRVKTLHPKVHGGILAKRDDENHLLAMKDHAIEPIDLIIINLYPFVKTVAQGADFKQSIEQIDIGGPAMIRSAAKNHADVVVITDPKQYRAFMNLLDQQDGVIEMAQKRIWAAKAFAHTAAYDQAIAAWFAKQIADEAEIEMPQQLTINAGLITPLRYGENPQQKAALYRQSIHDPAPNDKICKFGITNAILLTGKAVGYNNYADADAAFELVRCYDDPAIVIIKHANPCGVAVGKTIEEAFALALASDPISAFGGVVATNRAISTKLAEKLTSLFLELVVAPECTEEALTILQKKPNLRIMITGFHPNGVKDKLQMRSLSGGGYLCQSYDDHPFSMNDLKIVSVKQPNEGQLKAMQFAWEAVKHVKSNAILIANSHMSLGIGAGQMSRVEAAKIAIGKLHELHKEKIGNDDIIAASDAFFPFQDGLEILAKNGVKAIIQPGGSMRDDEIIAAANQQKIVMGFTGQRHFKH